MTINEDDADMLARLKDLKAQHRALDLEIEGTDGTPVLDQLTLTRLKKRKLALKDEMQRILDRIHPDIIA